MHRTGFSLVELSIVLVIVGLLAGGILSGQALIRAAEIRSISTDYQRYLAATNSFRDRFFAIPGDMANATSFWGKSDADCTSQTGTSKTPGTCNGNGDGLLTYPAAANTTGEPFRAWQHLALAGLIEGTFTGNAGSVTAADPDLGVNSPATKIRSVGWGYGYYDNANGGNGYSFNYNMQNWLVLGNEADNNFADGPALKTEDAWNIDTKLDDGKPGTGSVLGNVIGSCTNTTTTTNRDAAYNLASTATNVCGMVFKLL